MKKIVLIELNHISIQYHGRFIASRLLVKLGYSLQMKGKLRSLTSFPQIWREAREQSMST